jgi:hypothetical protein
MFRQGRLSMEIQVTYVNFEESAAYQYLSTLFKVRTVMMRGPIDTGQVTRRAKKMTKSPIFWLIEV